MSRATTLSFWHSRIRLSVLSIFLTSLIIILDVFDGVDFSDNGIESAQESSFQQNFDYALEALNYMYDLQQGKAEIRPVFENEARFNAYWRCSLKRPVMFTNESWLRSDELYLFSATYDRRKNSLYPSNHIIQVLAMSFKPITKACFCNIFNLDDTISVVVKATVREIWQRAWDPRSYFYIPNLISCPVPAHFRDKKLLAVSVVYTACKSSKGALIVRKAMPPKNGKKGVAVCVKGLDFLDDMATNLVEWIEAQFIMGADHITVYNYYVHPRTWKVLDYYSKKGNLTTIPITLPGESPNDIFTRSQFIWRNRQQKRRHELIPYNDCYYRHMDTHSYILIVDTDELVVPLKADSWMDMLNSVIGNHSKLPITSVSIRNVFKFPSSTLDTSVPEYMYMLRNRLMSEEISKPGDYGKSFTSTETVATVFNHFALHRQYAEVSRTIYAKAEVALKLHYKAKCPIESRKDCSRYLRRTTDDKSLDRFAEQLIKRVSTVIEELKL